MCGKILTVSTALRWEIGGTGIIQNRHQRHTHRDAHFSEENHVAGIRNMQPMGTNDNNITTEMNYSNHMYSYVKCLLKYIHSYQTKEKPYAYIGGE